MATLANVFYNVNQRRSNEEVDFLSQSELCIFISESIMYLLDLKDNTIQCREVERACDIEEYVKYVEHMKHIHKTVFGSPKKDPHPLRRDFADTIHYFQNTQPKKKLFCRKEDYYLVKKSFTEGIQYVEEGKIHFYKAIAKPLDIYISDRPLEPYTLRSNYDAFTITERISPGETKTIPSDTYYTVIAPCHTYFKKVIFDTTGNDNSTEISLPFSTDSQVASVAEDRAGSVSRERSNQAEALTMLCRMSMSPQPSRSRDYELGTSSLSMELERVRDYDIVNDSGSEGGRSSELEGESKRLKFSSLTRASTSQMNGVSTPQSPDCVKNEIIQANNSKNTDNRLRGVFAIRKDGNIESYTLKSGSTFRVLQDKILTGSFAIENDGMDPGVIEYQGDGQFIHEIATFKNGSKHRNTLSAQKVLLDELQDPTKKREEIVVNYFYEFAFNAVEATYKTIEATYRKFSEMRNMKMIGSCVPAIVPLSDTIFCGAVSEVYEAKP